MSIPGTNGPDRMQGGHSGVPDHQLVEPGEPEHGKSVPVRRQAVRGGGQPPVDEEGARAPLRLRLPEPADEPLPAAGRRLPDAAWHVRFQRSDDDAPERTCAGRREVQLVGGLPARAAERRRQGRPTPQSEFVPHAVARGVRTGFMAAVAPHDGQSRPALGDLPVPDSRRRAGRFPLRSGRRKRLQRRRRQRPARHRGELGQWAVPAARGPRVPRERQDRSSRRLRSLLGRPAVHRLPQRIPDRERLVASRRHLCRRDQRLPASDHAASRTEHGALRRRAGSRPGRAEAAVWREHDHLPEGTRPRVHPVLERDGAARIQFVALRPGGLCRHADQGADGIHQHQHLRPRHRQRGTARWPRSVSRKTST